MGERDKHILDGYIDALIERDGAAASLKFLPEEKKAACLTRIAELDQILDEAEAVYGNDQLDIFAKAVESRRLSVQDLIAHLERLEPRMTRSSDLSDLLSKLQPAYNHKPGDH